MNGSGWRKASASNSQGACVELKWRKADASNPSGSCVELAWHNASACGVNGECVEVSRQPAETGTGYVVAMRDSKNPDGPVLEFTQAEIAAFLDGAKKGEFDDFAQDVPLTAAPWEPADALERLVTGGWSSGSCLPEEQ